MSPFYLVRLLCSFHDNMIKIRANEKEKKGMDMNPKVTEVEKELMDKIMPLQGKHIFTKNYGDGEIEMVTRKNDLSGIFVYFHSNMDGTVKIDGKEFWEEVEEVKE